MLLINLLYFIISASALIISATLLVKSLSKISHFLRLPEFTTAFILMALATTMPELFVGISSALSKVPAISLGNIIGASLIDLTLIIGIITLVGKGIKIKSSKFEKDIAHIPIAIILILILYLIGNSLSRIDGIIILGFFIFNSYNMLKKRKKYPAKFRKNQKIRRTDVIMSSFIFILALIILFLSSKYAVTYASSIAADLNLPQIIIGIFLISIATTLPELVFSFKATELGHEEMALGDLTGAVISNLTLVTGITAIIYPIEVEALSFLISISFLFIASLIFIKFLKSNRELSIKEGTALIFFYIIFVIVELLTKLSI